MSIDVARAIEVAEHNGQYEGETLVVFNALKNDRYYGIRLEVSPGASAVGGWCASARDGVGRRVTLWWPGTREEAVTRALDDFLALRGGGIL